MPPLRKRFELYASIKPVKSYPNVKSLHKDVDIVFLREVTEGMQSSDTVLAGSGEFRPNDEITIGMRVITRKGSNRVAREAFEIARTRPRSKVTAVHKEPVYRLVCGMFAEECRKVAQEFPDVEFDEALVDTICDEARDGSAAVRRRGHHQPVRRHHHRRGRGTGRRAGARARAMRGRAAGDGAGDARLGARHRRQEHRESLRDDHVGQDAVEWLGRKHQEPKAAAAAKLIDAAMDKVIADGKALTPDLGGKGSTTRMGDAVAAAV